MGSLNPVIVGTPSSKASLDANFRNIHNNFLKLHDAVIPFNTLANMQAATPIVNNRYKLLGRISVGDGGGGDFLYRAGDYSAEVSADTFHGIYVPILTDKTGENGCFIRIVGREIYPDWYAINAAPGTTDMHGAISAALAFANSKKEVSFSPGAVYAISSEIQGKLSWTSTGPKINGNFATLKAIGKMRSVLAVGDATTRQVRIKDLILSANSLATYGFRGVMISEQDSIVENLSVSNAVSHGIYCDGCQVSTFRNIKSNNNGGDGYLFESCNGLNLETPRAINNAGNGITVQRGVRAFTGGMQIRNPDMENNLGHGIRAVDTRSPLLIDGGWLESNRMDGINISAVGVSVKNNVISGGSADNSYRAVRLARGASGCEVCDNGLADTVGSGAFARVRNEAPGLTNQIDFNYTRAGGGIIYGEYAVVSQTKAFVITGTTPVNNTPQTLFNFAGVVGHSAHIKLVITGNCTGVAYFTVTGGITIIVDDTAIYAAQDSLVQVNSGQDIVPAITISKTGQSLKVKFNYQPSMATTVTWVATVTGRFNPALISVP